MKITIKFDAEQTRRLEELARKLGVTKQAIVQEGVNLLELAGREPEEIRAEIRKRIATFVGGAI